MEKENLDKGSIFGYSMGGYVAMYLAKHFPGKIDRVITLATKFHWDPGIAAKETLMLDHEKIEQKIPAFAQVLKQRHVAQDWKVVLNKTAAMMTGMGNDNPLRPADYTSVNIPSLIMLGDRDKMVTLEETVTVYKSLPNAQMAILPATQHPIEQVDIDPLSFFVQRFLG
jgi:pimeloyl-ACP methyl ester carboxylesterase